MSASDFLPTLPVAIALASAVAHIEEYHSAHGHPYDLDAFRSAMQSPGVAEYMKALRAASLVPLPRHNDV